MKCFSVHATPEKLEKATIVVILDLRKTRAGKANDYRGVIVSEKFCFESFLLKV